MFDQSFLFSFKQSTLKAEEEPFYLQPLAMTNEDKLAVFKFFQAYINEQAYTDPVRIEGGAEACRMYADGIFCELSEHAKALMSDCPFNLGTGQAWLVKDSETYRSVGLLNIDSYPSDNGYFEWSITLLKSVQGQRLGTRCIQFVTDYVNKHLLNKEIIALRALYGYQSDKQQFGVNTIPKKKRFKGIKARILLNNIGSLILHKKQGFKVGRVCLSSDMNNEQKPCVYMYYPDLPKQLTSTSPLKNRVTALIDSLLDKPRRQETIQAIEKLNQQLLTAVEEKIVKRSSLAA